MQHKWSVFFVLMIVIGFFVKLEGLFASEWSKTTPQVNLSHIFEGEINKKGKPVGFHARSEGKSPEFARVIEITLPKNQVGVYGAKVEIFDQDQKIWKPKQFSTFFPDKLNKEQILNLILESYQGAKVSKNGKWRAQSSAGFVVEGWICPAKGLASCPKGGINTAYPIYKRSE